MSQAQFCLRFYEPARIQVLSVAIFGTDAVSPGVVVGLSGIAAQVYQLEVVSKLAAAGYNVQINDKTTAVPVMELRSLPEKDLS